MDSACSTKVCMSSSLKKAALQILKEARKQGNYLSRCGNGKVAENTFH